MAGPWLTLPSRLIDFPPVNLGADLDAETCILPGNSPCLVNLGGEQGGQIAINGPEDIDNFQDGVDIVGYQEVVSHLVEDPGCYAIGISPLIYEKIPSVVGIPGDHYDLHMRAS
jgi:hypothetical protein